MKCLILFLCSAPFKEHIISKLAFKMCGFCHIMYNVAKNGCFIYIFGCFWCGHFKFSKWEGTEWHSLSFSLTHVSFTDTLFAYVTCGHLLEGCGGWSGLVYNHVTHVPPTQVVCAGPAEFTNFTLNRELIHFQQNGLSSRSIWHPFSKKQLSPICVWLFDSFHSEHTPEQRRC